MATLRAWVSVVTQNQATRGREAVRALRDAGVELQQLERDGGGPGVVFFDRVTDELAELLRATSRGGAERVLAIGLSGAPLRDDESWALLEHGASDVIAWDHAANPAQEIAARFERWRAVDHLLNSPLVRNNLIGDSPAWRSVLRQAVEVAHFTDASVLVLGESGTGKELIARLIHTLDARPRKRDVVVLDCTTIVPELAGSEFFGHERGAFTGAAAARDGAFALADGGTLFLDEIGDLPLPLQGQLLRAVQERTYKRVGGNTWSSSQFRLVCATQRALADDVAAGVFRADLYYRIGGVVCKAPPLRDRPEDIILLFRHFVAGFTGMSTLPDLDEPVRQMLLRRRYPGNVRELQQLARRTTCRHVGTGPITIGDIPDDERPRPNDESEWRDMPLELSIRRALSRGAGLKEISRQAAEAAIRIAVGDANGNLRDAARALHVTDRALQMRRAGARGGATNGAGSSARRRVEAGVHDADD